MACTSTTLIAVLLSVLPLAQQLHAEDSPQWGGSAGKNMVSQEIGLPETFEPGRTDPQGSGVVMSTTQNVKWAAKLGDFSCSTPTVACGRVLIGGMDDRIGILKCFDEETGRLLWQWSEPCRSDLGPDAMNFRIFPKSLGVCSTPAVDGDRLYFVDQNCVVQCLDINGQPPLDGEEAGQAKVIWSFDMYANPLVACRPSDACNGSPLVDGDFVYIPTSNGVDRIVRILIEEDASRRCFAPDAPTLIVLDKRNGRFLARDTAPTASNMLHGQWSSPCMGTVAGRKLVFLGGGDGNCYAFEALTHMPAEPTELKTAWWVDCNPPEYRSFGDMDMITHYTLGDKRRRDTINEPNDGTFVGMSEIIATPVFHQGRVYVAIGRDPDHGRGRGTLLCLDPDQSGDATQNGILWCYQGLERSLSTVSIADDLLYVADVAGRLHCLDVDTGEPHWVHETDSRMIASTMVADGKIYMPTERNLHILAAGTDARPLSEIRLGSPSWSTPVAANGTIYIASKKYLWAVSQGATPTNGEAP